MTDFIGVYENALSAEFCHHCMDKFAQSRAVKPGETGHGVDLNKKNSHDLLLNAQPDWHSELATIQQAVLNGLLRYVRQWPYVLVGAISLQVQSPKGPHQITAEDIKTMDDAQLSGLIKAVFRLGNTNLQKYEKHQGGYFYYHSEFYPHPNDPQQDSLHRVLLWMFYLNDISIGGETEFYFQQRKLQPQQGALIIAPAGFTHTHRGNRPKSDDKYIFTSWLMYRQAAQLYGQR